MNILVLSREFPPYVLGGISYHLYNLYNNIVKLGHNVTVLSGKCPQCWNDLGNSVSKQIDVQTVEFGYRKGYYVLYPLALKNKLRNIELAKYDKVMAHTPIPYNIGDIDLITKYHDCVAETRKYMRGELSNLDKVGDSLLHPIRELINRRSLQSTDFAIFNSNVNKNGWMKNYDVDIGYDVVYNGVDTTVFTPECSQSEDFVLFVGGTGQKGLDRVIRYADLNERPVHVVGSVEINHDNIICHGRLSQEELAKMYSKASVTIHPAYFESFGNSVLESLACGTPVVTTDRCGASEILTETTGAVTQDINEGIETVVSKFRSRDCRSVAENYSWERNAEKTIRLLNKL